jgi:hypothetical protein
LQPCILIFPGVGQISRTLWLLVMGVNVQRWKERASTVEERRIKEPQKTTATIVHRGSIHIPGHDNRYSWLLI